jgi:hypothetical protein
MAENRRIWPLLVYGGLAAIAAARRAQTERTPAIGSREVGREPRRITYPAPDESGESLGESRPAAQVDPDKRPKEQVENDQPISAQLRRAKQQGRGRHAMAPWEIPWAGWKDTFWRVYASVNDNRLLAVAAGVVFYSLLAIFPAIAAFVSLYGLIADASIDSHLSLAAGIFPAGAVDILHEQIARLTAKGDAKLSLGFITGLVVALWSANAGMKAIIDALNVVYDEKEKRSFVKLIAHFGAYNATYGSLGAAVGMMMWMWISGIVILLGGELNAEIEHQTAHDFNSGRRKTARSAGRGDGRHNRRGKELVDHFRSKKKPRRGGLRIAAKGMSRQTSVVDFRR